MEVQGHAAMSFATILHSDAIQPHTFTSTLLPTLLAQLKSNTPGAYVRTCIHVCGAVCYVDWVNGSGPTVCGCTYVHTCVRMCDDIRILLYRVNGFMCVRMNYNILWYVHTCMCTYVLCAY